MKSLCTVGVGLILSFALAGCDRGPTDPSEVVGSGHLSFSYTGGLPGYLESGSFSADGTPVLDARGRPRADEWAVAASHPLQAHSVPVGSKLAVMGFAPRDVEGALFVLTMPRVATPTTVQISDACADVNCAQGLVFLEVSPGEPHKGLEGSCRIGGGVLKITSVEGGRIRGSFSGRGRCARDWRSGPFSDFAIEQGHFDVAVAETFRFGLQIWS